MILAGDIGGTKTVLGLYEESANGLTPVRQESFPSRDFPQFTAVLAKFLSSSPDPAVRAASFGVAGPVVDGRVRMTNLPWLLDEAELAQALKAQQVRLLNDLEAAANGMLYLRSDEVCVLNPGTARAGHAALVSAGTGLGEAVLYWDGRRHHPMASEGGHDDFAPQSDQEIELLKYLRREFGHVSYERILSGPGLFNVYRFLRDTGFAEEPDWLRDSIKAGNPGAVVSEMALAGRHPLCIEALGMFVRIYGAAAGNLAMTVLAYGGVYVGGGIAPKILPKLADRTFKQGFTDKGRYASLLQAIPVRVALNPLAPLIGAAHYAHQL
jgi:glucokinase